MHAKLVTHAPHAPIWFTRGAESAAAACGRRLRESRESTMSTALERVWGCHEVGISVQTAPRPAARPASCNLQAAEVSTLEPPVPALPFDRSIVRRIAADQCRHCRHESPLYRLDRPAAGCRSGLAVQGQRLLQCGGEQSSGTGGFAWFEWSASFGPWETLLQAPQDSALAPLDPAPLDHAAAAREPPPEASLARRCRRRLRAAAAGR